MSRDKSELDGANVKSAGGSPDVPGIQASKQPTVLEPTGGTGQMSPPPSAPEPAGGWGPRSGFQDRVAPAETNPAIVAGAAVAAVAVVIAICIPRGQFAQPPAGTGQQSASSQTQASGSGTSSGGSSGTTSGSSSGGAAQSGSSSQGQSSSGAKPESGTAKPNASQGQNQQGQNQQGQNQQGQNQQGQNQQGQNQQGQNQQGQNQQGQNQSSGSNGSNSNQQNSSSQGQNQSSTGSNNNSNSGKSGEPKLVAQTDVGSKSATHEFDGVSCDIGNLANGGEFAVFGKDIYYAKPEQGKEWVTKSIVKTQSDGKKKDVIYEAPSDTKSIANINALGTRLVFTETGKSKSYVVSVDSKGGDKLFLDECDEGSLCQVSAGMVYYQRGGTVYRCDPYGQCHAEIFEVGKFKWFACEVMAFTISDDATKMYINFGHKKDDQEIYSAPSGYQIVKAYPKDPYEVPVVIKSKTGNEYSLVVVHPTASETILWSGEGEISSVCSDEYGFIMLKKNAANDYSLFSFRTIDDQGRRFQDKKYKFEPTRIADVKNKGEVRYLSYFPDNVAFATVSDKCGWNAIPSAGGDSRSL